MGINLKFSFEKKIFIGKRPKEKSQLLRLSGLLPPPREIPFTLKLSSAFGNPIALVCWAVSGVVFLPLFAKFKKLIGFSVAPGTHPAVLLATFLLPLFFFALVAAVAFLFVKSSRSQTELLETGLHTYGTQTGKVDINLPDSKICRRTSEYEVGGRKYTIEDDGPVTSRLDDEVKEPIFYNPRKPSDSMLLDSLPARISVDDSGRLKHIFPFMGYVYAAIPATLLLAAARIILK